MSAVLRSPDYRPDRERGLHLAIFVADTGTSWCVQDAADGRTLAIGDGQDGDPWNDPAIPLNPASVSFVSLPEWSTLVPGSALVPGSEADHLALVHGRLPSGVLRDEPVEYLGARCIYVHDDEREHEVLRRWPGARPLPLPVVLLRAAMARSKDMPLMLLHRAQGRLDLVVSDREQVLMSNVFPARTASDVLYYTLMAMERCGLKPNGTDLCIGGLQLSEQERTLLARHVEHVRPAVDGDVMKFLEGAETPERWLALLEQHPCVS